MQGQGDMWCTSYTSHTSTLAVATARAHMTGMMQAANMTVKMHDMDTGSVWRKATSAIGGVLQLQMQLQMGHDHDQQPCGQRNCAFCGVPGQCCGCRLRCELKRACTVAQQWLESGGGVRQPEVQSGPASSGVPCAL